MRKTTMRSWMIRQGDVLVMRSKRPTAKKWEKQGRDELGRVVLAAGEVTGHHHAIGSPNVCMLRAEGISDAVLTIGAEFAQLVHEEHATIDLPKGRYVVRIQREWSGAVSRRVED